MRKFEEDKLEHVKDLLPVDADENTLKKELDEYWEILMKKEKRPLTDDFRDLVLKMLSYDPMKRPTIQKVKTSPWMR